MVALPWTPWAWHSAMAWSMALLMTAGSMEYSSGMGLVTSMPPFRPIARWAWKAAASSAGVSRR